ncbi:MAG: energy transducer TonB [Marinoscillum sp.]
MIKYTKIYVLIAVLFLIQACGSTNEKNNKESAISAADAIAQRRAVIKRDSTLIANKRLKAWNDLVAISPTYTNPKGTIIYHKAEVNPTFIGGDKAMMKYLRGSIEYPEQAEKDKLEGTVFVDFVVSSEGNVNEVEVTSATSSDVDQAFRNEAVRLVSSMPKWTPGKQNNQPVNVKYSIPITFQIL